MSSSESTTTQRKPQPQQKNAGDIAAVFGSSGACGKHIVNTLLARPEISEVYSFRRSPSGLQDPKLKEVILTGDLQLDLEKNFPSDCDVVFSGLATTIKQAGTQEAMFAIDYGMNDTIFTFAREKNVPQAYLISSTGANEDSYFWYMKLKGQLENRLANIGFARAVIVQPGLLIGAERTGDKARFGEGLAEAIMTPFTCCFRWLSPLLMPINVKDVGEVMVLDYVENRNQNKAFKSSYANTKAFKPVLQRIRGSVEMLDLLEKYKTQSTIPAPNGSDSAI